jgi:hypothetical protein
MRCQHTRALNSMHAHPSDGDGEFRSRALRSERATSAPVVRACCAAASVLLQGPPDESTAYTHPGSVSHRAQVTDSVGGRGVGVGVGRLSWPSACRPAGEKLRDVKVGMAQPGHGTAAGPNTVRWEAAVRGVSWVGALGFCRVAGVCTESEQSWGAHHSAAAGQRLSVALPRIAASATACATPLDRTSLTAMLVLDSSHSPLVIRPSHPPLHGIADSASRSRILQRGASCHDHVLSLSVRLAQRRDDRSEGSLGHERRTARRQINESSDSIPVAERGLSLLQGGDLGAQRPDGVRRLDSREGSILFVQLSSSTQRAARYEASAAESGVDGCLAGRGS